MDTNTEKFMHDMRAVVIDAEELLKATAGQAGTFGALESGSRLRRYCGDDIAAGARRDPNGVVAREA